MTNFATILVEKLFTEQERYNRNCRGGGPRNKEALNPKKLKLVKRLVFSISQFQFSRKPVCGLNVFLACMWRQMFYANLKSAILVDIQIKIAVAQWGVRVQCFSRYLYFSDILDSKMGVLCAVFGCGNNASCDKTKSFFRIPKIINKK
mgnify:CR=1 FL=1